MKKWQPLVAAVCAALPLAAALPGGAAQADQPPAPDQVNQQLADLLSGHSAQGQVSWQQRTAAEANWLIDAQLPDGAITQYVDRSRIAPYLGNYAAMGLATATRATGDKTFADASWNWLHWYADHEDGQGFVTDYTVSPSGTEVSTGDMDSTDAYAGTFLMAAEMTYQVTKDRKELESLQSGVEGAVHAIAATTDSDGLTWAKPSWHMKYLMDEAEVYGGLRAASKIDRTLGDTQQADTARANAQHCRHGEQDLWNAGDGAFDWAKGDSGTANTTNWNNLYPDTMEQAWAVGLGLTSKVQTQAIESHLNTQRSWENPDGSAQMMLNGDTQQGTVGYWPMAGLAVSHHIGPVRSARNSITDGAVHSVFQWPFNTGVMGQLMLLRRAGLQLRATTVGAGTGS